MIKIALVSEVSEIGSPLARFADAREASENKPADSEKTHGTTYFVDLQVRESTGGPSRNPACLLDPIIKTVADPPDLRPGVAVVAESLRVRCRLAHRANRISKTTHLALENLVTRDGERIELSMSAQPGLVLHRSQDGERNFPA